MNSSINTSATLPLEGRRLILRRLCEEDLLAFQAYRTDPVIASLQGWSIATDEESLGFLTQMQHAEHFEPGDWFQVGVALGGTNHLIGDVGICAKEGVAEIGFSIHGSYHKQGYGTEAVELAIAYIFATSDATQIIAHADVRNIASWRLLERVGMTRQGLREREYKGELCQEYTYKLMTSDGLHKTAPRCHEAGSDKNEAS